uniref:Uncharacterized protein n=1 Tax=Arundo donax TaxID=35708 RepID=A0A0A9IGA1_ARUDO
MVSLHGIKSPIQFRRKCQHGSFSLGVSVHQLELCMTALRQMEPGIFGLVIIHMKSDMVVGSVMMYTSQCMVKAKGISSYYRSVRDAVKLYKWDHKYSADAELDEYGIDAGVLEQTLTVKIMQHLFVHGNEEISGQKASTLAFLSLL